MSKEFINPWNFRQDRDSNSLERIIDVKYTIDLNDLPYKNQSISGLVQKLLLETVSNDAALVEFTSKVSIVEVFARELVQNSLDAAKDESNPVEVIFEP